MNIGKMRVGIGFATGRKSFKKVLNSYIYGWEEISREEKCDVSLHLFVAYDLAYKKTQSTDYTNLSQQAVDMFDELHFLGDRYVKQQGKQLTDCGTLNSKEVKMLFGSGYAGKRNTILYAALENHMDYLLFLDDDEYPLAVTNNHGTTLWSGQNVLKLHLKNIKNAYITNGYHCGYISPIPQIHYNNNFTEDDFRRFIESISNDVIHWESAKRILAAGGVTYADTDVLLNNMAEEVVEENQCKFITGANLCINLTDPRETLPFYNPPGARGEDTFLSTLLAERKVIRIPCYTFHDGFSVYHHLLDGVLPIRLEPATSDQAKVCKRFLNACIGWIRYKPLLLFITDHENYEERIASMRAALDAVLSKICAYFENDGFYRISEELNKYDKNVENHHAQFQETLDAWEKLMVYREQSEG